MRCACSLEAFALENALLSIAFAEAGVSVLFLRFTVLKTHLYGRVFLAMRPTLYGDGRRWAIWGEVSK